RPGSPRRSGCTCTATGATRSRCASCRCGCCASGSRHGSTTRAPPRCGWSPPRSPRGTPTWCSAARAGTRRRSSCCATPLRPAPPRSPCTVTRPQPSPPRRSWRCTRGSATAPSGPSTTPGASATSSRPASCGCWSPRPAPRTPPAAPSTEASSSPPPTTRRALRTPPTPPPGRNDRSMSTETVHADIMIVGGGLAGVCAAIAAARQGRRVALAQNRPVLGGNSSSEVRVWVCGATAHGIHMFARETGIMGELCVENQYRNPDGNPYYWDLLLLEKVRAEENIELFLNTDITEVDAEDGPGGREIRAVTGWMSGSERRLRFEADAFIDCSGDGLVGHLAGAESRRGSEPRSEFDESWAPEHPGEDMLGSTILFYTKDVGHPQRFVPPPFAVDITATSIPANRVIRQEMNGCDYWWIEWGGDLDVVRDNERIRDELQAVCYGIWDYIKNSGLYDAETLSLEWIGAVPGKREYRRFVGDRVLTQHDVLGQTEFADRVAFGGWSIDLHPVGGVYASERGSRHWHPDGNYHIPLRCLYSRDVANLWMAGRDISASHVAFGSTRVMATCAILGEAAGIG